MQSPTPDSSSRPASASLPRDGRLSRPVAIWVYTGVIMLLIQVILGGITRLTGSGLSITEWNVATGAVPPLNTAQWQDAFDKYRQTPQFRFLNSGFSLSDFKFIFFWEWFHRFWARMVGVVFLVGFAGLLWKRKIRPEMIRPLIILFLLGALQGAVGWIMVVSGFQGDATYVEPTRLALHFVFALGLIVYTFWLALQLSVPDNARLTAAQNFGRASSLAQNFAGASSLAPLVRTFRSAQVRSEPSLRSVLPQIRPGTPDPAPLQRIAALRRWTIAILVVLVFQLSYGALMAGHKAANVAPTWPTINGSWIPPGMFAGSLPQALAGNRITVQFIHRGLAYGLLLMVLIWTGKAARLTGTPAFFRPFRWLPLLLVGSQIFLGISSLLTSPWIRPQHWVSFDWLAQLHQVTGLLFLLTMIAMLYFVVPIRRSVIV